jgi:hypothetical protein
LARNTTWPTTTSPHSPPRPSRERVDAAEKEQRDEQIAFNRSICQALRARDAEQAWRRSHFHLTDMTNTAAAFPLNA